MIRTAALVQNQTEAPRRDLDQESRAPRKRKEYPTPEELGAHYRLPSKYQVVTLLDVEHQLP